MGRVADPDFHNTRKVGAPIPSPRILLRPGPYGQGFEGTSFL